jgi:aerobic C4-dicarboxylate transport protein
VAPVVFLTVVVGIIAASDFKRIGKVGLLAMVYFEIASSIALAVGLLFGNLSGVGKNLGSVIASAGAAKGAAAAVKTAGRFARHLRAVPAQRLS